MDIAPLKGRRGHITPLMVDILRPKGASPLPLRHYPHVFLVGRGLAGVLPPFVTRKICVTTNSVDPNSSMDRVLLDETRRSSYFFWGGRILFVVHKMYVRVFGGWFV